MKRNDFNCPTNDFVEGKPIGKCWGDGHYMCNYCKHLRSDFKFNNKKRELLTQGQGGLIISYN
jgi:hypothetical protein